ncbi:penicillin acylase family protein [Streptomyces sp. L7]
MPSQNLVYADTKNNIGYTLPGKIPVRGKGDGSLPVPGWDSKHDWTGYIPQAALPYEYNPKRGYIVTANQAVIDKDKYPYTLTTDWGYGTRSQRITDLIQSKIDGGGKISTDDMRQMQLDDSSEIAKLLVPKLLKIDEPDPDVRQAQKLLEGLGLHPGRRLGGCRLLQLGLAQHPQARLRQQAAQGTAGQGPVHLRLAGRHDRSSRRDQPEGARVRRARRGPGAAGRRRPLVRGRPPAHGRPHQRLVDDPKSGTRPGASNMNQLFKRAMIDARWELTAKLGKDIDTWSWGRLHRLFLKNQTLGTEGPAIVQYILNRGPWKLSGGEATVNATGWNAAGGYGVVWVPSMRMVVNLDNFDKSKWINLTGASGHAFSAHYTDQTGKWVNGELLPWSFSSKAVDNSTSDTLVLKP